MENTFKINTFQLNLYVSLISTKLWILQSLFRSFGKGSFIGKTSNTFEYHYYHHMLLVEPHFKPRAIQDKIHHSCKIFLIFNEGENIFAFRSINFLAFTSA